MIGSVVRALRRARLAILTVGLTYLLAVAVGAVMVHAGNGFALSYRDRLLATARAGEPALVALQRGMPLRAALIDFAENLFLGAVPTSLTGLTVVSPYGFAAFRGWIGGIVSMGDGRMSRLAEAHEAAYYIITLVLQLIPYTLSGGAGVSLGLSYFRPAPDYRGDKWIGYPKEAIRDYLRIYLLVVPLFLFASLWEFLAR